MSRARVAFYGDDFTGSVDVLLQFARRGWSGRLFTGLPSAAALARAADEADVVGVAGIARSLPPEELDAELRPVLTALAALDPHVVQYKACSTADSSPVIGSVGRVLEIGRAVLGDRPVPMLFAQPDFGRYTAFGHHFAAENGLVHRLDRQPTMSTHPSTPMRESELAVHLSHQTALPIGALPFTAFTSAEAIADALLSSSHAAIVLDALDDAHLALLGEAISAVAAVTAVAAHAAVAAHRHPLFVIGSGGLSRALALAQGPMDGDAAVDGSSPVGGMSGSSEVRDSSRDGSSRGPVLVVSGSRSPQTRRQAEAAAGAGWAVRPLPFDDGGRDEVVAMLTAGRSVVLTSDDAAVTAGADPLPAIAGAAASIALAAVRAGAITRLIVCGGDTSSRVTRLLGVESLSIVANPWGNVVLLRAHSADPAIDGVELLLKGGQVGAESLFVDVAGL